ncbi:Trimeric LpxA-like [Parasponia andersonii]|uniref:Trimeric LpxA-like n=1 Tax=Parasponia andersonii TaxID=3476 RepID=A0A2P5DQW9_PARAD|nr:Trimeric LpxA-like [Parasponia andersonii]
MRSQPLSTPSFTWYVQVVNSVVIHQQTFDLRTKVRPHCMPGEDSRIYNEFCMKRSVLFCHCQIGSDAKVVHLVVMNHVPIRGGFTIQASLICGNVQLQ